MCTYDYPSFVDKEKIYIEGGKSLSSSFVWRTYLVIPFENKKNTTKVITFLMKNPSYADKKCSDKTINNILFYVKRLGEVNQNSLT